MAANDFRLHKNVQNPGLTKYYGKHADSEQADVLISEWGGRRIGVNAKQFCVRQTFPRQWISIPDRRTFRYRGTNLGIYAFKSKHSFSVMEGPDCKS